MSWPSFWKTKRWQSYALWPLSKLVCWEASRRLAKFHQSNPHKQSKSIVIVVGNVVVGGTGKTPFIIWLVKQLKAQNLSVGIISRGYGSKNEQWPKWVTRESSPNVVGDEPYMLAMQTGCPVAVAPQRCDALELMSKKTQCDVIISDDGLQHYALPRDIEVAVIDAQRQFGNGWCLPAGPLREPIDRLSKVNFTIWNGIAEQTQIPLLDIVQQNAYAMQLTPACFRLVSQPGISISIDEFLQRYPLKVVTAIAGIGNPQRFFETLEKLDLVVDGVAFDDHYNYQRKDFEKIHKNEKLPNSSKPLVMTQKDAVKCTQIAQSENDWWYLEVVPTCPDELIQKIIQHCQQATRTEF